ncbi:bifunctional inhibitor/lipid-transfer protein/seed storage 2S albumin superfamily protein [Actinidia rufa]|uniref:Bifunctional inhibitor/lipid-transfer protein/seed storage 2S albumin superfamily protein n=1 Tax=Actinidia rufa TaxID=165716 RepID=A0A7J0HG77_9ERIC|nr:bifunctional inhibitor/lipid-transfer protein/seed storage 2S albumin superfamily protein [Actinidia rufa]
MAHHQRTGMGLASRAKTFAYLHTVLATVIMLWTVVTAQSSDCTKALISMSPCLNYITGNPSTPTSRCCQQLASVVRLQSQCLCEVLNGGGSSMGINVNQTQAVALPGACNVQTPPISRCNGKSAYGFSPLFHEGSNLSLVHFSRLAASPADSPAGTPQSPNTITSGTRSKTVPSTKDGSKTVPLTKDGLSDASSTRMTVSLLFVLLFIASYASTSTIC